MAGVRQVYARWKRMRSWPEDSPRYLAARPFSTVSSPRSCPSWQGLASRLSQESEVQRSELLEMPHIMEQDAVPRAILVD